MPSLTRLPASFAWSRAGMMPVRPGATAVRPWDVDRDRYGRIDTCDVGPVRLARIRVNPLCIEHPGETVASPGSELWKVLLQVSGHSVLQQDGREVRLLPGDWTLYRSASPFSLFNLERCEQRLLMLPRAELWGGTLDVEDLAIRRFGSASASSRHLVSLLDSAFDTALALGEPAAIELAAAAIHLARLALLESAGIGRHALRSDVIRSRVCDYIERNLHDPGLSPPSIAAALSCSTRYLHKVFAPRDETIAQYILNRRLEKCAAALTVPEGHTSIAEVAYSWGFKSLSYFSKAFSRRYGKTPSEQRMRAGLG
jgi:AraC family transcriptional regulator, positive regulator of tynA and feaB